MINIRLATASDFNSYSKMRQDWQRDYAKAGDVVYKQTKNEIKHGFKQAISWKGLYIITVDGKVAGYHDLAYMNNGTSNEAFINIMYVKPAFRNQGIAKFVRECAQKSDWIKGTIISYGRVQRKLGYFIECGFTAVAEYPEQIGTDKGLCFLLFNQEGDAKPLNIFGLAKSREEAYRKAKLYAENGGNNLLLHA